MSEASIPPGKKWVDLRGNETLLLVENEEDLLSVFSQFLSNLGYQILEATDGEEGVRVFNENKDKIDVAVLDVAMPRLAGDEALKQMREIRPGLKAVLSSGLPYSRIKAGDLGTAFLAKPYSITTLAQTIRKILDVKPGA